MKEKILGLFKGEYLSAFIMVGIVQVLGMGLNYGVNIWLANQFTVSEFGVWSYSFQTIILIFMAFALVGNPQFIVRETIRNIASQRWDAIKSTLKRSSGLSAIGLIVSSLVLYFGAGFWYKTDVPSSNFMLFLVLYGVTFSIGRLRQSYQQATGQNKYSQIPERIVQPIIFGVIIIVFYMGADWGISDAIRVYSISSLIAVVGSFFFIKSISTLQKENASKSPIAVSRKKVTRKYFFLIAVVDIVDSSVDLYLIKQLGFEEVAFYSVSKRIASLVQMILVASNFTFIPLLNQYFIQEDKTYLQKRIYKVVGLNIAIATLLVIALLISKDLLLGLFKSDYVEGVSWLLYFLALLAQWFNIALGMPGAILNVSGNEKVTFYTFSCAILLQLILGQWIIPFYGMEGMAFVYVVNTIFWNLTMAIIARRKTGLKSSFLT